MAVTHRALALAVALALALAARSARAQDVRIADVASTDREVPVRLMGYGLVVGLDGTGDRATGLYGARQTVQSVVNLLRNFGVQVPVELLRTRNVAAVLVTAEASPFLRAGGHFEVQVASVGDATSLRGGVLWATPLVTDVGGQPLATAQGPLLLSDGAVGLVGRHGYVPETAARIPAGGLLAGDLPRQDFAGASRLQLKEPSLEMATRIAAAINGRFAGAARVEDPGSIALKPPADSAGSVGVLAQVAALTVKLQTAPVLVIDGRDGTVAAGGDLPVGSAVVSYGSITLAVGKSAPAAAAPAGTRPAAATAPAAGDPVPGEVRVPAGTTVQDVAAALHAVAAPADAVASIFESLREVGAIVAEVRVR